MSRPIPCRDAFLLLAAAVADGVPAPTDLGIDDESVSLKTETLADGRRWLEWFGVKPEDMFERVNSSNPDKPFRSLDHKGYAVKWRGRYVHVRAYEDLPKPVESKASDKVRAAAAQVTDAVEMSDVAA